MRLRSGLEAVLSLSSLPPSAGHVEPWVAGRPQHQKGREPARSETGNHDLV